MDSHGPDATPDIEVRLGVLPVIEARVRAYVSRAHRCDDRETLVAEVMEEVRAGLFTPATAESIWGEALERIREFLSSEARRRRRVADFDVTLVAADDAAASRQHYRLALWRWEDEALGHLTTLQRAALELHEMDGVEDEEIALTLGCARQSVRVLRHKAKSRLRHLIGTGVVPSPPTDHG